VRRARVAGRDRPQGRTLGGDTEQIGDGPARLQRQVLRQVGDVAGRPDRAAGRGQLAGHQPEQGRLATAIAPDKARAAGAEGDVEAVEHRGAVGPGEAEVGADDG
jgi:hypothetical protein